MPDRWNEERERIWRERNWRNEEDRQAKDPRQGRLWREDRSFDDARFNDAPFNDARGGYGAEAGFDPRDGYEAGYRSSRDRYAARFEGRDRDRVFGERDSGAGYNQTNLREGGAYGYRGDQRRQGYGGQGYGGRPAWQEPDYAGVSPAYENGEYELERNRGRFESQDYTRGGRGYGDDRWNRDRDLERRYASEMRRPASGGTGGYDYERGYGDGGRGESRGAQEWDDYRARASGFFQKAKAWLGDAVDEVRRDLSGPRDEQRYGAGAYREAEARWSDDRGYRGRGPKDYKRSDERISDDAHQRLTEDAWLDASEITVAVSNGEVTLSGAVESREAKHRAERSVEGVHGVTHVQNNLRIDAGAFGGGQAAGESPLDAQLRKDGGDANANGGTSVSQDTPAATSGTTRRT